MKDSIFEDVHYTLYEHKCYRIIFTIMSDTQDCDLKSISEKIS
jgi:hypothetical protein